MESLGQNPVPSLNDALTHLAVIEQRMRSEGAVDSEGDTLTNLRVQLQKGSITPERAIRAADQLAHSRQNYH